MRFIPPLPVEDHVCAVCNGAYPTITVEAALRAVRIVPTDVRAAVASVSDGRLRLRPDDSTWSMLEYVCHLRDVYASYTIRLYRTRVENSPVLEPMLNDLRAARFSYNGRHSVAVVAELADNAAGLADEAARFSASDWDRVATRMPGEERSARWMLRQAMHEGVHHLRDIESVRRRLESGPDAGELPVA